MQLDWPITELWPYSIEQLKSVLPAASDSVWDERDFRQRAKPGVHNVHHHTRSIVFRWLSNQWTEGRPLQVEAADYAPKALTESALAVAERLEQHYGGVVVKLMLAELKPSGTISPHSDAAPALYLSHRCHLPILTNRSVDFRVDDKSFELKEGVVYELDNTRMHSVRNGGRERRVHLICDIMPEKKCPL